MFFLNSRVNQDKTFAESIVALKTKRTGGPVLSGFGCETLGGGFFGFFHYLGKCFRMADGHVGQYFAVQVDLGLF